MTLRRGIQEALDRCASDLRRKADGIHLSIYHIIISSYHNPSDHILDVIIQSHITYHNSHLSLLTTNSQFNHISHLSPIIYHLSSVIYHISTISSSMRSQMTMRNTISFAHSVFSVSPAFFPCLITTFDKSAAWLLSFGASCTLLAYLSPVL